MKKTMKYLFAAWLFSDEIKSAKNRIVEFIRRKRNPNNPTKETR
jgi:hypothetical protein